MIYTCNNYFCGGSQQLFFSKHHLIIMQHASTSLTTGILFFFSTICHSISSHLPNLHNALSSFASPFLNYSLMSSTTLLLQIQKLRLSFPLITPIPHCTQTQNCRSPWSIATRMLISNDGLQQWRFVATLELIMELQNTSMQTHGLGYGVRSLTIRLFNTQGKNFPAPSST